jgi:hypothetical protein
MMCWAIAAFVVVAGLAGCDQAQTASGTTRTATATVKVGLSSAGIGLLPEGYLGLSVESGRAVNSGQLEDAGNLPQLLDDLGPGVLRFGGISVDEAYQGATTSALDGLGRLVRATDWQVIYTENLGQFATEKITADARAVAAALGSYLETIACGNEPDGYVKNSLRSPGYSEADYLTQAQACIRAVRAGDPGARVSGPDVFKIGWLPRYASAEKGTISLLAYHYYPLSDCGPVQGTAVNLLSRATAQNEAARISAATAAAAIAGVPLRITETNSASCGGIPGVSNTYAAALWAVDYLLIGAEQGASGMNFHGSLTPDCPAYTPLCLGHGRRYVAEPVFYGLLFTHLLGTGELLPVSASSDRDVAAHAVKAGNGTVRVAVENLSDARMAVSLRAGQVTGTASAIYLTGPSLSATSGVRIQGAAVRTDGSFTPGPASQVTCDHGTCPLTLAPYSAVIITLPGEAG